MVRIVRCGLAVAACLVGVACAFSAPETCTSGGAGAGVVVDTIHITENGAASPDTDPDECREFVLKKDTVRRVLEGGESIGRRQYMHQLPWSPCLVRGRAVLADGREATWTIRQYGTGSILLDDGQELFLWCRTCTSPPFVPVE